MDAVTSAVGEERASVRISPQNNIDDSNSQALVNSSGLAGRGSPTCVLSKAIPQARRLPTFEYVALMRLLAAW
jgi:hypothetical protein